MYVLSDFTYYQVYYLIRYRRKIVRNNLVASFPEKSSAEILKIEKQFYHFFCDYLFETFKLLSVSKKNIARRMQFEGLEDVEESFRQGRSCGAYLGHYCNWEWISTLQLHIKNEHAVTAQIYHTLRNKAVNRLFLKLRGRMGAVNISMKETLRQIVNFRNSGTQFIIGFISDQTPKWENIHYWKDFLHRDTPVFTGTERLARQTNMVMYYTDVRRPKRGYYVATFRKMTDSPKDLPQYGLTQLYMEELEKTIRREPQYWLWTHNRWKRTREEFDKMYETSADGHVKLRKEKTD